MSNVVTQLLHGYLQSQRYVCNSHENHSNEQHPQDRRSNTLLVKNHHLVPVSAFGEPNLLMHTNELLDAELATRNARLLDS